MATTSPIKTAIFATYYPNTNEPFQRLIMAAADAGKNAGKKSLFGRDKGKDSFVKFLNILTTDVASALHKDGRLADPKNPEEILNATMIALDMFKEAYPNWQDAYLFMEWFNLHATGKV